MSSRMLVPSALRSVRMKTRSANSPVGARLEPIGQLCGVEKGPELVFGGAVLGIRDVSLFEYAAVVHADQKVGDMLLKREVGRFPTLRHGQGFRGWTGSSDGDSRAIVAARPVAAARMARVRSRSTSSRASFSATGRCASERRKARLLLRIR